MGTTPAFGVITALPKEYAAVKAMLNNPTEERTGRHQRRYLLGEIPAAGGGSHVVAVVLLPVMGNNSAATRAALLVAHFPDLRHILMVGLAGAAPCPTSVEKHVRLGDIVVSGPHGIVQYDYVAEKIDDVVHRFPPRPPGAEMLEAVRLLEADELAGQWPWLAHIARAAHLRDAACPDVATDKLAATPPNTGWLEHPSDPWRVPGQPRVFVGKIGSANILLKNPQKRDRIQSLFDVRAFEMEGSGIADASWDLEVGYLVIRGTCDYCDSHKGDAWQGYAAVVAAAYMRALIESIPGYPPRLADALVPTSSISLPTHQPTGGATLHLTEPGLLGFLPRGILVAESLVDTGNESWCAVINHYTYQNEFISATHYHESYASSWHAENGFAIQLRKLRVHEADAAWARSFLDLVMEIRHGSTHITDTLGSEGRKANRWPLIPTDYPNIFIFPAGEHPFPARPSALEMPAVTGDARDLVCAVSRRAAELEPILRSSPYAVITQDEMEILNTMRRRARVVCEPLLGKDDDPHRYNLTETLSRPDNISPHPIVGNYIRGLLVQDYVTWMRELVQVLEEIVQQAERRRS